MKDSTTGTPSKGKAVSRTEDGATEGKKKFEVKKVLQANNLGSDNPTMKLTSSSVECRCSLGLGYRC